MVCVVASASKSSVRSFYSQTPLFPASRRPEALAYTNHVVTLSALTLRNTSHEPLTFVRVACSVLRVFAWWLRLSLVIFKMVCACAIKSLCALPQPTLCAAHARFADDSLSEHFSSFLLFVFDEFFVVTFVECSILQKRLGFSPCENPRHFLRNS